MKKFIYFFVPFWLIGCTDSCNEDELIAAPPPFIAVTFEYFEIEAAVRNAMQCNYQVGELHPYGMDEVVINTEWLGSSVDPLEQTFNNTLSISRSGLGGNTTSPREFTVESPQVMTAITLMGTIEFPCHCCCASAFAADAELTCNPDDMNGNSNTAGTLVIGFAEMMFPTTVDGIQTYDDELKVSQFVVSPCEDCTCSYNDTLCE